MERLVELIGKLAVYAGYLFFGGGILVGIGQYAVYNGFGNWFEYVKAEQVEATTTHNSQKQTVRIDYTYWVNKRSYSSWLELTEKKSKHITFMKQRFIIIKNFRHLVMWEIKANLKLVKEK